MGKKILIIDDDRDVQAILRTALEKAGYQTFSALDAMQGPMMTRQVQPNLVILDIMMPAGGGVKVYERIRQIALTLHLPVLIYSAVPRDQIESAIPPSEGTVILTKPAMIPDILAAVEKLLS